MAQSERIPITDVGCTRTDQADVDRIGSGKLCLPASHSHKFTVFKGE